MPSERKPSTDQVLTKTPIGFGFRARWVSRSAMWMPLTPRSRIEPRPALAVARSGLGEGVADVAGDVEERLLDEPRHHAGIGAAAGDGGRPAGVLRLLLAHGVAERVVGALLRAGAFVEVEAGPRLDDGVDVERAEFAAEPHDVERGGVDREVDAEAAAAAGGEQRRKQVAIVLAGHGLLDEADVPLVAEPAVAVARIDHHEARRIEFEMALDERQHAPADRAEADHHQGAVDPAVNGPVRHRRASCREGGRRNPRPFNAGSRGAGQPGEDAQRRQPPLPDHNAAISGRDDDDGRLFLEMEPDRDDASDFAASAVAALLLPLAAGAASAQANLRSGNAVFDRAVDIVLANFYRPAELDPFRDAVALTVESFPASSRRTRRWSTTRSTSCFRASRPRIPARYPTGSVEYYELLDVFRYAARDAVRRLYPPEGNITYDGIGIATRSIDGATFVTDVYDGGPADKGRGDGRRRDPLGRRQAVHRHRAVQGHAPRPRSILTVRREAGADPMTLTVPVERLEPSESLVAATADSVEVIERDGYRIGYLRIWAYTERDMKATIEAAIAGPLARCRRAGARPPRPLGRRAGRRRRQLRRRGAGHDHDLPRRQARPRPCPLAEAAGGDHRRGDAERHGDLRPRAQVERREAGRRADGRATWSPAAATCSPTTAC